MKININIPLFKQDIEENEYVNVVPFPIAGDFKNTLYCNYQNIDEIVDYGEAEHIFCKNVLNFIPHVDLASTLSHWCKKLKHQGKITLHFEDINEICRLISIGSLSEENGVKVLYGEQNDGWNFKKSGITVPLVKNILVKNDMIIEDIKLDSFFCYIEARRK